MRVSGQNIYMNRGDSESITFSVRNQNKTERNLVEGDKVELFIAPNMDKAEETGEYTIYKCIEKFASGRAVIHIDPADTEKIKKGSYAYKIKLTTADGTVTTIIEPHMFVIK